MVIHSKPCMILACSSLLFLNGCSTPVNSANAIPEGGLTVSQLYQQSIEAPAQSWSVNKRQNSTVNYEGYTRTAQNEIQILFKPLENPQIPIYVFPHVALIGDEQLLKPGFTTAFFLYKQNQWALPSEKY